MRSVLRVAGLACLAVLMTAGGALASGFALYEWSSRGNAMGGAVMGSPTDASTIATNPAGMTDVEGHSLVAGVTGINPMAKINFDGAYNDASGKSNVWLPPHAYFSSQLNDKWWIGLGAFSRFGLGTEYDEQWTGRYNVTEASIESLSVNPNLAYKLSDKWSFAVGGEVMWLQFLQRKTVDHGLGVGGPWGTKNDPNTTNTDTDAKLLGDSIGLGLTLSAYHKPLDWLSLALTYRSQVKQTVEGDATFTRQGSLAPPVAGTFATDTDAEGDLILPDSVSFGVAVKPLDKLTLEGDVVWTRWSTYQELRIKYGTQLVPGNASSSESTSRKEWRDTFRYQIGAEYALYDWLDLRAGFVYDQSPMTADRTDYMIPANDRKLYSGGLGFHWEQWTVDLSYIYLECKNREYSDRQSEGILASKAVDLETHIVGFTVGYRF